LTEAKHDLLNAPRGFDISIGAVPAAVANNNRVGARLQYSRGGCRRPDQPCDDRPHQQPVFFRHGTT
jgi:hypothetical protein